MFKDRTKWRLVYLEIVFKFYFIKKIDFHVWVTLFYCSDELCEASLQTPQNVSIFQL